MIHCETTLDITRSPAGVFAFVDDFAKAPAWLEQCLKLEQTSPPPRRVGSTLHYTYRQGARPGEMDGAVTEYEPGRRLGMTFGDRMFEVVVTFDLQAAGAGTRFTHTVDITPRSLAARLMSPVIRIATRRQVAKDTAKLRELLSAGTR